ncbi:MAG: hypothetical protein ACU0DH_06285 [Paracoccus sp. (in: a-proteobacteria)]|uniref:hypothetical protein n=1 Tax=Paracoccus sp. TaxID=267 RepID=UPI004057F343
MTRLLGCRDFLHSAIRRYDQDQGLAPVYFHQVVFLSMSVGSLRIGLQADFRWIGVAADSLSFWDNEAAA